VLIVEGRMIGLHIAGLSGLLANDVLRVYTVGTTYKILREVYLNRA
jgi:hypothetical protein